MEELFKIPALKLGAEKLKMLRLLKMHFF